MSVTPVGDSTTHGCGCSLAWWISEDGVRQSRETWCVKHQQVKS